MFHLLYRRSILTKRWPEAHSSDGPGISVRFNKGISSAAINAIQRGPGICGMNPYFKHEMQSTEDDVSELVLFTDNFTDKTSAPNHNFPETPEWRRRDLIKPHSSKPNLWQHYKW